VDCAPIAPTRMGLGVSIYVDGQQMVRVLTYVFFVFEFVAGNAVGATSRSTANM